MSRAFSSEWANRIARACAVLAMTATLAGSVSARAATEAIEFPDDELASESVLPIFDNPISVKNRIVTTKGRFELGLGGGMSLLEPFYSPLNFGGSISYQWSEESAINLSGTFFLQGLSDNAKNLNPIRNTVKPTDPDGISVNLQYAPSPKYLLLANYQYTGFYGKISLGKDFVMNLSLYAMAGAGAISVGEATKPVVDIGLGQKFYFTPNFGLRADLKFFAYQGPDVLSINLDKETGSVAANRFAEKMNYSTLLTASVIYLFPGL